MENGCLGPCNFQDRRWEAFEALEVLLGLACGGSHSACLCDHKQRTGVVERMDIKSSDDSPGCKCEGG